VPYLSARTAQPPLRFPHHRHHRCLRLWIKSPFSGPWCVLALAGIQRLVTQSRQLKKAICPPSGGWWKRFIIATIIASASGKGGCQKFQTQFLEGGEKKLAESPPLHTSVFPEGGGVRGGGGGGYDFWRGGETNLLERGILTRSFLHLFLQPRVVAMEALNLGG